MSDQKRRAIPILEFSGLHATSILHIRHILLIQSQGALGNALALRCCLLRAMPHFLYAFALARVAISSHECWSTSAGTRAPSSIVGAPRRMHSVLHAVLEEADPFG